jgi:hypothetical protein
MKQKLRFFIAFLIGIFFVQCAVDHVDSNGGTIISSPPIVVFPGERFEYEIALTDDLEIDAIFGQWPEWMCLKEDRKLLKGKPEAEHEGNHNIRLRVQSNGKTYEQAWVLTVASRPHIDYPMPWETGSADFEFLNIPLTGSMRDWAGTLFSEKPVLDDDFILVSRPGRIIEIQFIDDENNGQSCFIILENDDNTRTLFSSIDPHNIFVEEGQYITAGSKLARTLDPVNFAPVSWFVNSIESVLP